MKLCEDCLTVYRLVSVAGRPGRDGRILTFNYKLHRGESSWSDTFYPLRAITTLVLFVSYLLLLFLFVD